LLHLISTEDAVKITAQRLEINIAGCQLVMENGHVTITMPGEFTVKTMQFTLGGPVRNRAELAALPKLDRKTWIALNHFDADHVALGNIGYKIFFEGNQVIQGKLSADGKARHDNVPEKAIKVEYELPPHKKDVEWDGFNVIIDALEQSEHATTGVQTDTPRNDTLIDRVNKNG
jgi:type VI secretion system secreted protein VgrG